MSGWTIVINGEIGFLVWVESFSSEAGGAGWFVQIRDFQTIGEFAVGGECADGDWSVCIAGKWANECGNFINATAFESVSGCVLT